MDTDQDREDDVGEGEEEGREEAGEPGVDVEQRVDADVVLGVGAEVRAPQDMDQTEQEPQHVTHQAKRDVLKQTANTQVYSPVYHFPKSCLITLSF